MDNTPTNAPIPVTAGKNIKVQVNLKRQFKRQNTIHHKIQRSYFTKLSKHDNFQGTSKVYAHSIEILLKVPHFLRT